MFLTSPQPHNGHDLASAHVWDGMQTMHAHFQECMQLLSAMPSVGAQNTSQLRAMQVQLHACQQLLQDMPQQIQQALLGPIQQVQEMVDYLRYLSQVPLASAVHAPQAGSHSAQHPSLELYPINGNVLLYVVSKAILGHLSAAVQPLSYS